MAAFRAGHCKGGLCWRLPGYCQAEPGAGLALGSSDELHQQPLQKDPFICIQRTQVFSGQDWHVAKHVKVEGSKLPGE